VTTIQRRRLVNGKVKLSVVVSLCIMASLLLLAVPFGAQAQSGQDVVLQPEGTVIWSQLPPAEFDGNRPSYVPRRHLPRDPAALATAKAAANAGASQAAGASDEIGPLNVNLLTNFIGLTFADGGGFIPPDNATAAGPSHVFQMINVRGAVFDKVTGAKIGANINLGTFFGTGGQGLSDPIVRFDPTSSRFFAAIITTTAPLKWAMAVSQTNNPTGAWSLYSFAPNPSNCTDYPNMGISDDKVVLTANAFTNCSGSFLGAEFVVINKAQLVAGTAAAATFFAPDAGAFTFRAAQNLSSDNNIYMVAHNGNNGTTNMRVYTVSGLPAASTVTGTMLVSGVGQAGLTVLLKLGSTTVQTTTTNASGAYTFNGVAAGTYNVKIKKVPGPGTFSGNISVDAVGQAGRTVKIGNGGGTTTTDGSGNFSKAGILAGNHTVTIKNVLVAGSGGGVSSTFVNRAVLAMTVPPDAQQSGGAPLIATNDNRLLDASFRNGSLFTTACVACTPAGDGTSRACVKVTQILNPSTTATVNQDFNFGINTIYMYFPAISITSANDVISVFSRSSAAEFAGVWASGRLSGDAANTFRTPTLIKAGEAHYSPFANRWGDYSSVAIDPSDQTKAWVSGEYACPGGCANGSNWGTWIGQTSITP